MKIRGHIDADSGTLNNVVIAENCTINGTLKAEKIIGDLVKCAGGLSRWMAITLRTAHGR
nr:hypothetical protein [Escherichia coli]